MTAGLTRAFKAGYQVLCILTQEFQVKQVIHHEKTNESLGVLRLDDPQHYRRLSRNKHDGHYIKVDELKITL